MSSKRTHNCNEMKKDNVGETVCLKGWAHRRRDHGGVIFIDLRDVHGITQVTFDPTQCSSDVFEKAGEIRNEYVLSLNGKVQPRPDGMINKSIPTGEIEVIATELEILNKSKPLPFTVDEETTAGEALRLKHRYIDLRRPSLQKNIVMRSKAANIIRNQLAGHGFLEIETPILYKSTPEGARDYLVPSRVHPGQFYALPQSPQIMKQLLMMSSFDRYFQIARCFRDEDLRYDRQPEFTQIDIELCFPDKDEFLGVIEEMLSQLWSELKGIKISSPFKRLTYVEAMDKYGIDKPDLRFALVHHKLNDLFANSEFNVFKNTISSGGLIKGICLKSTEGTLSRKDIDELTEVAKIYGAKGLAWVKVSSEGALSGGISKFLNEEEVRALLKVFGASEGDAILMIADEKETAHQALSSVRLDIGKRLKLYNENDLEFLWVTDFPLFEYDPSEKRVAAKHHPFTTPSEQSLDNFFSTSLEKWLSCEANAYDCVLNGNEIGGGSFRIFDPKIQSQMFHILGISPELAQQRFGFFLEALDYGCPPHGGVAMGFDRIMMLLCQTDAIRDVIAFPKTQKASDILSDTPSEVSHEQLFELGIEIRKEK